VWVEDPKEGTFLVHGLESVMREIFGNVIEKIPTSLYWLYLKYNKKQNVPQLQSSSRI
jgi:hypothetical protein